MSISLKLSGESWLTEVVESSQIDDIFDNAKKFLDQKSKENEELFKKIKLRDRYGIHTEGIDEAIEKFKSGFAAWGPNALDQLQIIHQKRKRKQKNYLAKLHICIRYYNEVNQILVEKCRIIKQQLLEGKLSLSKVNFESENLCDLISKAAKYRNIVLKFEKKYPFLCKAEYDLLIMKEELNFIKQIFDTRKLLQERLDCYKNLKPNCEEAKQQLAEIKEQFKMSILS